MPNKDRHSPRWPYFLTFLLGAGLILLALGADLLGFGGESGLGLRQKLLLGAGIGLAAAGLVLISPIRGWASRVLASQPASLRRPVSILHAAVWFGLVAGLGEVFILIYRKTFQHTLLLRSRHFPWMVPLGDVLIFTALGLAIFLLRRSKPVPVRFMVFLFAALSFTGWLSLLPKIHILAALLLAIGMALQLSRLAARRSAGFFWTIRTTTPVLTAAVALLMIGMLGRQAWLEQRILTTLPPPPQDAPNILLIVMDTVRAESLSAYGYSRPTTPNLARLVSAGVRFEQAFATAPWTLPSHASMFTGRWHHELSVDWSTPLDGKYPTLAEVLSAHGYTTGGFVANTLNCGYEGGLQRGFQHYEDYKITPTQILLSTALLREVEGRFKPLLGPHRLFLPKTAAQVNAGFLRWIDRRSGRPFFAFLNYMDAHGPYRPPAPFDSRFGSPDHRVNSAAIPPWEWTPDQVQAEVDAYDGAIAYLDDQIGRLYTDLESRGLVENTVIIITSDHGEQFGEHKIFGHANSLYVQALRVPLIILFPPGALANATFSEAVSLRDLPATLIDLAKIENSASIPGETLTRIWGNAGPPADADHLILSEVFPGSEYQKFAPANKGGMKSLVNEDHHYILNGDGTEELYDFGQDPEENRDLAALGEPVLELEQFRSSIRTILAKTTTFLIETIRR